MHSEDNNSTELQQSQHDKPCSSDKWGIRLGWEGPGRQEVELELDVIQRAEGRAHMCMCVCVCICV